MTLSLRNSPGRLIAVLAVPALVLVGCSSDGDSGSSATQPSVTAETDSTTNPDASSVEAFCAAGAELRSNIESLADLDVLTSGVSGFQEKLSSIGENLTAMKDAGADVAGPEIDQLQEALDGLGTALGELGSGPSVSAAGDVASAVQEVGSAGSDVLSAYSAACE